GLWIAIALLVVAAAIAVYIVYGRRPAPAPAAAVAPARAEPPGPLGKGADQVVLPPLANTDPLVRELVRKLTSHPSVVAWLATNGLIRNFTVVVANVVEGVTPARQLRPLQPRAPFEVVERNGQLFIDSRSYQRYDAIAAAATSIDPA